MAAVLQEKAVEDRAAREQDPAYLGEKYTATYNFDTQKIEGADSFGAYAHEMARALTQSDNAWIPRLVAPVTLILAGMDYALSFMLGLVQWLIRKTNKAPPVDEAMLSNLQSSRSRIRRLLAEPALPEGSGIWVGVMTGILAVYKNSRARAAAAELAARQQISSAA